MVCQRVQPRDLVIRESLLAVDCKSCGLWPFTSTDVADAVLAAVRTEPASYCVNIDAVSDENALLAHFSIMLRFNRGCSLEKVDRPLQSYLGKLEQVTRKMFLC